jgi:hypothetical protein
MFGLGGLNLKIVIGLIIALALSLGAFYFYVQLSRSNIERKNLEIAALQKTVNEQNLVISVNKQAMERMVELNNQISLDFSKYQQEVNDLRNKFDTTPEDVRRDTNSYENDINRLTNDNFRCNELATGFKLRKEELDASYKNRVCQELIDELKRKTP